MSDPIAEALATADVAAIDAAVDGGAGVLFTDWRNTAEAVVEDLAAAARSQGAEVDWDTDDDASAIQVRFADRQMELPADTGAAAALAEWSMFMQPQFEIRALASTTRSDSQVLLLRSVDWWQSMEQRYSTAVRAAFAKLEGGKPRAARQRTRARKPRNRVAAMLRFPGEWAADDGPGPRLRDVANERLEEGLASPMGVGRAVTAMRTLGTVHSITGQAQVLDGVDEGWQQVRLGYLFHKTAVSLSNRLFEHDPRPNRPPRTNAVEIGHVVATCLALDDPEPDDLLGCFAGCLSAGTLGDSPGPYAQYLLALSQLRGGAASVGEIAERDLGPYAPLFAAWEDESGLVTAVRDILEYHVSHSQPSNRRIGEFEGGQEQAFAAEVVAFARVRESLGLPFPGVEHELWQTPLAQTRGAGRWPEDSRLARCVEYTCTVKPPHPNKLLAAQRLPGGKGGLIERLRRSVRRWLQ